MYSGNQVSYENLSENMKQKLKELKIPIINDFTTGGSDKALSAESGKELKSLVDEKAVGEDLQSLQTEVTEHLVNYVKHPANGGTTNGTATAYTCNTSPNPTALADKMGLMITVHVDSGANPTLKWGSIVAKSIKKPNGSAANLKKNGLYTLRYNSVNDSFILQGEGGEYGNAVANDVRKGKTIGTENELVTGTLDLSNLKPENLLRGITIDGVTGVIDKAHGKLVTEADAALAGTYYVYEDNRNNRRVFPIDDGEKYELTSWGTAHTVTKFNAAGVATQTVPLNFAGETHWFDIVRAGEVQLSRQFGYIQAYDWNTGVWTNSTSIANMGMGYVTIKTPVDLYNRMIVGIGNNHQYVGIYNLHAVVLSTISWCEYIDSGSGMVRQLADHAVLVSGKGAAACVMINGQDWQTIRAVYFTTQESSSSLVGRALGMLMTLGRKI